MRRETKGWSKERRAAQAERCRKAKPSQHSTGPKTAAGKLVVRDNAYKHGLRSAEFREILKLLKQQKEFIKSVRK